MKYIKKMLLGVVGVIAALAVFAPVRADAFYFPLEELIKRADLALKIEVTGLGTLDVLNIVSAEVLQTYKGEYSDSNIRFVALPVRELDGFDWAKPGNQMIVFLYTPPLSTGKYMHEINTLWETEAVRVLIGPQGVMVQEIVGGSEVYVLPATPIREKVRRYKIKKWSGSRSWSTMFFSHVIKEDQFAKLMEEEIRRESAGKIDQGAVIAPREPEPGPNEEVKPEDDVKKDAEAKEGEKKDEKTPETTDEKQPEQKDGKKE